MVGFKASMSKETLQEIAAANGIETDGMTKAQIVAALEAHNAAESAAAGAEGNDTTHGDNAAESATEGAEDGENGDGSDNGAGSTQDDAQGGGEDGESSGEGNDTTTGDSAAESATEGAESGENNTAQEYDLFVYAGPSLPRGRLKQNTVFNGTFGDVKKYLADVLKDYPQVEKLIVPAKSLATFAVKVKTPGNIAHKYYTDIVSTMSGRREV